MSSFRLKALCLLSAACLLAGGAFAADTSAALQATINQANDAANRQDYAAAIPLYEQAIQKLPPGHPDADYLKRNLGVLYANYAVSMEEQKKFDAALQWFDKALPLVAGDERQSRSIREGKAGTLFMQAMHLRDTLEDPTPADYTHMKALLDQALQLQPDEPHIQKGLAGVYLDEAYRLASDEKYSEAMPLLEQAVALDPQSRAVRESLANVYLGMAKSETPNTSATASNQTATTQSWKARRQAWVDKAIATEDNPRIRQSAERLLAQGDGNATSTGGKAAGFATTPGNVKTVAPQDISKLSVAEMVREMERQLAIDPPTKATLAERLETVETQVLGKPQTGGLATRTKSVYTTLMGSSDAMAADAEAPTVQAPPSSPDSYIDEIFKVTDGRVIRWGKFPLRVYIEKPVKQSAKSKHKPNPDDAPRDVTMDPFADNPIRAMQATAEPVDTEPLDAAPAENSAEEERDPASEAAAVEMLWRDDYKQAVLDGFNTWKDQTNGFVKYVEIQNPDAADVVVHWSDRYTDRYIDPENAPDIYKTYTPPKRTPLMRAVGLAAAFTPGYYRLAPQALNAALQYKEYQKLAAIRAESKITLGLLPTEGLTPEQAKLLIQNMAAKEFGHALGLKGASPRQGDLLYPELRHDAPQLPTQRDLATLQDLYNRPPNIVLNVR